MNDSAPTVKPEVVQGLADRYLRDQDNADKSGYRTIELDDQQMELCVVNALMRNGGMPMHRLMITIGCTYVRAVLAVGRLQQRGHVDVDRFLLVTINLQPRPAWYRRLLCMHPCCWLISGVAVTTAVCALWILLRSLAST